KLCARMITSRWVARCSHPGQAAVKPRSTGPAEQPSRLYAGSMDLSVTRRVRRYSAGSWEPDGDELVAERPVELQLDGTPLAVLMCTPGMERELATGFALTEGILVSPSELAGVTPIGIGDRFRL